MPCTLILPDDEDAVDELLRLLRETFGTPTPAPPPLDSD